MLDHFEQRIQHTARQFPYPPTPKITLPANSYKRRQRAFTARWAWMLIVITVLLAASLSVPQIRAAVLTLLRIGAVEIEVTQAPELPLESLPDWLNHLSLWEKTLEEAYTMLGSEIQFPDSIGAPNRVFIRPTRYKSAVIFVWFDDQNPQQPEMLLYTLPPGVMVFKTIPFIEEIMVAGQQAIWGSGKHPVLIEFPGAQTGYLVENNILIWTVDDLTFRLETHLDQQAAVQLAESLR